MPSIGNNIVWKTIYETEGIYYVDAIRAAGGIKVYKGGSVARFDPARDMPWLANTQQGRDVEHFIHISDGYNCVGRNNPNVIWDMRYSLWPNQVQGSLAIVVDPAAPADAHVSIGQAPMTTDALQRVWDMVLGR